MQEQVAEASIGVSSGGRASGCDAADWWIESHLVHGLFLFFVKPIKSYSFFLKSGEMKYFLGCLGYGQWGPIQAEVRISQSRLGYRIKIYLPKLKFSRPCWFLTRAPRRSLASLGLKACGITAYSISSRLHSRIVPMRLNMQVCLEWMKNEPDRAKVTRRVKSCIVPFHTWIYSSNLVLGHLGRLFVSSDNFFPLWYHMKVELREQWDIRQHYRH